MARFARIDLQIRADRLICANLQIGSRYEPIFCESRFGARQIANRRFEASRANLFARIARKAGLRIAGPSKIGNSVGKQGGSNLTLHGRQRTRYGDSASIPEATCNPRTCTENRVLTAWSVQVSVKEKSRYGNSVPTPNRRYGNDCRRRLLRTLFPRLLFLGRTRSGAVVVLKRRVSTF